MTTEYLIIAEVEPLPGRKTKRWSIRNKHSGIELGRVEWSSPWRQYSYFTDIRAAYNTTCLRDIASFIEKQMQERKHSRKRPGSEARQHLGDSKASTGSTGAPV